MLEGGQAADIYSNDAGQGKGFKDLLARQDIHAVIIACGDMMPASPTDLADFVDRLPILNQPEYIRPALEAGKHVLSEKPIAENMKDARKLVEWYESSTDASEVTWSVAENFRFLNSLDYAAAEVAKLGRVLTFNCRRQSLVTGGKYFGESQVSPVDRH